MISNIFYTISKVGKFCPHLIIGMFVRSVINAIIPIMDIIFISIVLENLIVKKSIQNIFFFILILNCFRLVFSLLGIYLNEWIIPKYTNILNEKIKIEIYAKISEIDYEKYEDKSFYDNLSASIQQSDMRMIQIINSLCLFVSIILSVTVLASILVTIDAITILIVFIDVLITVIINIKVSQLKYQQFNETIEFDRKKTYIQRIFNDVRNVKNLKLYLNFNNLLQLKYKESANMTISILKKFSLKTQRYEALSSIITIGLNVSTLLYLLFLVLREQLIASSFITVLTGVNQMKYNLINMASIIPTLVEHGRYIEKMRDFLNIDSNIEVKENCEKLVVLDDIKMENISFKYPLTLDWILKDFSINIKKGEKIALVGRNGTGKSTIIKLLCRFYNPTEGEILFNNVAYKHLDPASIRSRICIVFQEMDYYPITILENVLMRKIINKKDDEIRVNEALKKVDLYTKVSNLKDGIYTKISREFDNCGTYFSGGEYQKLMIARAYAKEGDVLIFDEPSSSLDTIAENDLFDYVINNFNKETIIFVTHTLSNIKNVDKIYYLENGSIKEKGTHQELMDKKGKYFNMFLLQSRRF